MKHLFSIPLIFIALLSFSCRKQEQVNWKIAANPILTKWAADVDPSMPWLKYPRPDMVRDQWMCLNGIWEYAITRKDIRPEKWEGNILVPYPLESALSGVKKTVDENKSLWYRRSFNIPNSWKKQNIILNFEASDWETRVWIDGKEAGLHRGGYDPFSFDITPFLRKSKSHEIIVSVWDPTDKGTQPRGKQVSEPGGIWYTSTTGIWQTVWIEPVNASHIGSFRVVADPDNGTVTVKAESQNTKTASISFTVKRNGKKVASGNGPCGENVTARVENPVLWSPDDPVLYDLDITLREGNKKRDVVKSYTGFRKISLGKSEDGFTRILLNNKFVWQNGPLDQGFWPDGLYTPPTEEAMVYDLRMLKKMGFNMLRKHVKVENRIFYYWCDKLGLLVWQDMPSGDAYIGDNDPDIVRSEESASQYKAELRRMIETKYNHPSIVVWVPFNEGWGQFETAGITSLISKYDPTRLVNSTSGWSDRKVGNMHDIHNYPEPAAPAAEENRAIVLGEFGGLGLPVQGHTWEQRNWGYRNMEDSLQLLSRYEAYYDDAAKLVREKGLSATVYTQTTDVETETNGLMTYDREINKMGVENVFMANNNMIPPSLNSDARIFHDSYNVVLRNSKPGGKIYYTTDGSEPTVNSTEYKEPFTINQTTIIKAFSIWDKTPGRQAKFEIEKKELMPASGQTTANQGIKVTVYDGNFSKMPDFSGLKPSKVRIVQKIDHSVAGRDSLFAAVFEGFIKIPEDGVYGLSVNSDDGSKMVIDGLDTVTNDGIHGMREEGKFYPLAKGLHSIRIEYFQRLGGIGLQFLIEQSGAAKKEADPLWLYH